MELIEILKAYYITIIVMGIFISLIIWKIIRDKKRKKKTNEEISLDTERLKKNVIEPVRNEVFAAFTTGKKRGRPAKEEVEDIDDVDVELNLDEEFKNLKRKLIAVHQKKEIIREQGLKLKEQFEKYEDKENYITMVMTNIENARR